MHPLYIDGAWVAARATSVHEAKNPATLSPLDRLADCGEEDVDLAVHAAAAARAAWAQTPRPERLAALHEMARRMRVHRAELALSLSRECGKPRCEALDCLDAAAAMFERCGSEEPEVNAGRSAPAERGGRTGVMALLTPYNFPILSFAASAVSALAAGATLICKPSAQCSLTLLELVRRCDALPAGVINIVTGAGACAERIVTHPEVAQVSFTGSSATAHRLQEIARGKLLDLEVGSLDVFIVCQDADLERAVPAMAWSRLMNGGQTCAGPRHIYVARAIAGELVDRLHQYVGFLDVDDPSKTPTDLGPLISSDAAQRVEDQVGRTLRAGAGLILGGRRFRPSGLPGHFFQPTILSEVPPGSAPTAEEILGPVITLTPVRDLDQALELSARAPAPAAAWVYSGDAAAAARSARARSGGSVFINDPGAAQAGAFGGLRPGRILAALGAKAAQNPAPRVVREGALIERKPWWFPYLERKTSSA